MKKEEKLNNKENFTKLTHKRGISLIVLIVTIIVIIILAAVILTISKNNPVESAREATFKEDVRSFQDELALTIAKEYTNKQGQRDTKINATESEVTNYIPSFKKEYEGKFEIVEDELIGTKKLTDKEKKWLNDISVNVGDTISIDNAISLEELLANKEDYIGDFVNYDAGVWTKEEISSIKTGSKGSEVTANNSTTIPSTVFQFGGFTAGSSRNGNATPYDNTYNYIKDKETGEAVTGWRIFDITEEGITLISAGCPEDYYNASGTNYPYYSEYILTENINSKATSLNIPDSYTKRDWSVYVNNKANSATVLTKNTLENWYSKYMGVANAKVNDFETFRKIYGTNKESLIDNYSFYWLACASISYYMSYVHPDCSGVYSNNDFGCGVRVLVSLKSNIQLTETKNTKTVTSRGADYTYNIWGLK